MTRQEDINEIKMLNAEIRDRLLDLEKWEKKNGKITLGQYIDRPLSEEIIKGVDLADKKVEHLKVKKVQEAIKRYRKFNDDHLIYGSEAKQREYTNALDCFGDDLI